MKTASERLIELPELLKEINRRQSHLDYEISDIMEEWEGLGLAKGQRDDSAAAILKRIRPHLEGLSLFLARCDMQCGEAIENPFAREV